MSTFEECHNYKYVVYMHVCGSAALAQRGVCACKHPRALVLQDCECVVLLSNPPQCRAYIRLYACVRVHLSVSAAPG
jgi:hypothetical protein